MNITADTNVLVRALVADEPKQARAAQSALRNAERVAISPTALCELVWVLSRGYGVPRAEISSAIRQLAASANVETNHQAVVAGLAMLDDGGDFADGVVALDGTALGGETFVSFDKEAVRLLTKQGKGARALP